MAAKDQLEAVRALEARVLSWIIFAVAVVATPIVLFGVLTEVRASRFDASLIVLLATHTVVVTLLFAVRAPRFRAGVVVTYLLIAGTLVALHYGPIISVGLFYLAAAMLSRIFLGQRAMLVVFAAVAAALAALAVAYLGLGAPCHDAAASDPARPLNWLRMGVTAFALVVCIALLVGIVNDGIAAVALEAQAALARERKAREERRAAEAALTESQRQEIVGRIAAGAAHDLNNVLTAVMGAADLAGLHAGAHEDVRKELALISGSAERAAALTRQLLSFSRRQITQRRRADLAAVVRDIEGLVQRLTPSNIEIAIDAPRGLPLVLVDPAQIEQVVLNLCVNARDAMPDGGSLAIRVFEAPLPGGEAGVAVSVRDTGTGIPAEVQARMFDPFFTTKSEGRGTGLGLATTRTIVEGHGGAVACDSRLGTGTTMTVTFPRAEEGAAPSWAPAPAAGVAEARAGREAILLCDDDESIRETAARILEGAGYAVLAVGDGERALGAAAAREFDLAVIDAVMPGLGGRRLYEELKRSHPRLRCLFSTGYDPGAFGQEFFDDPAHRLLAKPYGRDALLRAVREALDAPRG